MNHILGNIWNPPTGTIMSNEPYFSLRLGVYVSKNVEETLLQNPNNIKDQYCYSSVEVGNGMSVNI